MTFNSANRFIVSYSYLSKLCVQGFMRRNLKKGLPCGKMQISGVGGYLDSVPLSCRQIRSGASITNTPHILHGWYLRGIATRKSRVKSIAS